MNKKLLRKVKNHILKYPEAFDMSIYAQGTEFDVKHPCGTTACIAGWTCVLEKDSMPLKEQFKMLNDIKTQEKYESLNLDFEWSRNARKLLGITPKQGEELFDTGSWPDEYAYPKGELFSYLSPRKQAEVAAKRIEHFIKTGE